MLIQRHEILIWTLFYHKNLNKSRFVGKTLISRFCVCHIKAEGFWVCFPKLSAWWSLDRALFSWQAFAGKDLEEQLRAVSSVDELMSVLYPDYWKMYKCQLRKGGWQQPTLNTRTGDTVKFAAAHYNTEILKSKYGQQSARRLMCSSVMIMVRAFASSSIYFKFPLLKKK